VAECLVDIGISVVEPHLSQDPRKRIVTRQKHLITQVQTQVDVTTCQSMYFHTRALRTEDDDWVKKCMEYEVEGPRPRGRPKRTWTEIVEKDCQARKLNTEDVVDRSR